MSAIFQVVLFTAFFVGLTTFIFLVWRTECRREAREAQQKEKAYAAVEKEQAQKPLFNIKIAKQERGNSNWYEGMEHVQCFGGYIQVKRVLGSDPSLTSFYCHKCGDERKIQELSPEEKQRIVQIAVEGGEFKLRDNIKIVQRED